MYARASKHATFTEQFLGTTKKETWPNLFKTHFKRIDCSEYTETSWHITVREMQSYLSDFQGFSCVAWRM